MHSARRCVTATKALRVDDAAVTGATDAGLWATRVKIRRSDVTGSTIDIVSRKKPRLVDSTCGTSENLSEPGTSWGVCSLD